MKTTNAATFTYAQAVKDAVLCWLRDEADTLPQFTDRDEARQYLYDTLWAEDAVTGNGSGSFTCDREAAKAYVLADLDAVREAFEEFGDKAHFAELFFAENWEAIDVTARCYALDSAVDEAVERMEKDHFTDEANYYLVTVSGDQWEELIAGTENGDHVGAIRLGYWDYMSLHKNDRESTSEAYVVKGSPARVDEAVYIGDVKRFAELVEAKNELDALIDSTDPEDEAEELATLTAQRADVVAKIDALEADAAKAC